MNVIDVLIEIDFIADHVLPKPALPSGSLPPFAARFILCFSRPDLGSISPGEQPLDLLSANGKGVTAGRDLNTIAAILVRSKNERTLRSVKQNTLIDRQGHSEGRAGR
jgi:hypothetical protein